MSQVMITIVAPLAPPDIPAAHVAIQRLGNPADPALTSKLDILDPDGLGVHFMSLHALASFDPGRAHLILEMSADGDETRAIRQVVAAIGVELATVFALAGDWRGGDMAAYLSSHVIRTGFGIGASPGLGHAGTPGMTVGRIRDEAALAARISVLLAEQPGGARALARLEKVRVELAGDAVDLQPGQAKARFQAASLPAAVFAGVFAFAQTYLWPFGLALLAWSLAAGLIAGVTAHSGAAGLMGVWRAFWRGLPVLLALLALVGAGLYLWLRKLEITDWMSTRAPERSVLHEMIARENACAQNHMVSVTELKAGWLRRFTIRLTFFVIATLGSRLYAPGYLGPIGTIHFARWVTVPGTRDFIFLSNYGGSWEAYLEDFITLAHLGLTGVWSNSVGFPKTSNLVFEGATDGERFKRFARQSMKPTLFWYSAYPELTTDMIRANSGIRRGLSGAMSEDDAQTWLCYFGSALRPDDRLVTSEIQSLLFGGLGFLPYSALTLWKAPDDVAGAAAWLKDLSRHVAYNDGRRLAHDDTGGVVQIAFSAAGLTSFGLPKESLETFPPAFLDDMSGVHRARILGDNGPSALQYWWWGQTPSDVAVIVYAKSQDAFDSLMAELDAHGARHGARRLHTVDMEVFDRGDNREPFGFADGGSQPVIRGTYKGLRSGDPLHLVEPGEFILGYPDNRGNLPPGPTLAAIDDPDNELPVLGGSADFSINSVNNPRDLGFNGSYLVIRQLEQDPDLFNDYLEGEAERLKDRLGPPYKIDAEFLAAKLMGRWRNGAPLVRSPYSQSASAPIITDNSFELGFEDPEGLRCPFGAHIRRANPRDSLNPGSTDQIAITNRHRTMRIGRKYAPANGQKPGLLFMCLNGDIERQFEFIQQTWVRGNVISLSCPITLSGERDPVIGGGAPNTGFTIPTPDGPVKLKPTPNFVTTRGGGYFFLPGKRLIDYLAKG